MCVSTQRLEEIKSLQDEVARVRAVLQQLTSPITKPRLFVKPSADEPPLPRAVLEESAPGINRWSIYTALKCALDSTRHTRPLISFS